MEFDYVDKLIIDDDEVLDRVRKKYYPEDIYSEDELVEWAINNGFVR